jgi:hydroxylysine kinase
MQNPAGSLLTQKPPQLAVEALARHLRDHWGLTGSLVPLASERDQNHRLETAGGQYTVKLANPAEPAGVTGCQTLALVHCAAVAPDLPVPRVVPTRGGAHLARTPDGILRVLTWCPGVTLAQLPPGPALAARIGRALGRLDVALAGFQHPASDHSLLWDIRNAADLAPLIPSLPEDLVPVADRFLGRFATEIAPALAGCPRQVIHGDFNPHNLLADPGDPTRLTGIIDFGDMTLSHRICDLAVAASYLAGFPDPVPQLAQLVAGYRAECDLTAAELALLPDLITARLITTLTITAWRAARYPENAAYILRNAPAARAGLAALAHGDVRRLDDALRNVFESAIP